MDSVIFFLYEYGKYAVIGLAILKVILILIYKGFDIGYLIENFLVIYSDEGIEPNERRIKFRKIHNIVTILFYLVAIIWIAIAGVVKYTR